ncbi:undecaprenyl-diphosphate phosphatase [Sorangium sp. So ce590]|uniref:undecaprenyl-diphosphate phosphatase n=1 Tax=Sorangium sp. So ce590 TaxID=3133317 RepID=UPI003F5EDC8D
MFWFDAVLLGVLEGLTEFLPVSSTGHLILLGAWLGHQSEAAKTLDIVIQLGAVLAVVVYFRERLAATARGIFRRDPDSLRLALALAVAFVPAAVVGLLFHKAIKAYLFGPGPVAVALIAGGLLMIGVESARRRRPDQGAPRLEDVTLRRALAIGVAQCFSLWPGASRSMATIVGGQLSGLSTGAAAEFSFLLAIPTLGAATVFDLAQNGRALLEAPGGAAALVIGLAVSFAVALLVIAVFLRYLKRYGLAPFGWYRIALGTVVVWLWFASRTAPVDVGAAAAEPAPRGDVAAAEDGLARADDHPSRP